MILDFEPREVMKYFKDICAIPHGSKNINKISDYLMDFSKTHKLKAKQDELGNVIIFKPATEDKKNSPEIILQGHMDMVAVKEDWCKKDLEREGLELEIDGDYVSAKGTSLGGDDGIAVAYALAILASDTISHPDITAIFTVDEEIGMLGAAGIDLSDVKGKLLMNMDSEDEGIFLVSCAGGATVECHLPVEYVNVSGAGYKLSMTGFLGGHSGTEIDKGRANANIIFGRLIRELENIISLGVASLCGGDKDNAIANSLVAELVVEEKNATLLEDYVSKFEKIISEEYSGIEKELKFELEPIGTDCYRVIDQATLIRMTMAICYIPNGLQKMSGHIKGLVETSLNLGIMRLDEGDFNLTYAVRSSMGTAKQALITKIETFVNFLGGDTKISGDYPAWEYRENSMLRDVMTDCYEKLYGEKPKVEAIHAGVECGILSSKIDDLDCVSFGPQMYDIHTTNERLSISSVHRTWKLILEVLKRI